MVVKESFKFKMEREADALLLEEALEEYKLILEEALEKIKQVQKKFKFSHRGKRFRIEMENSGD
jgi:hypothetical protein